MINMSQHSVLNAFDFAAIDEMDPALCKLTTTYNGNYDLLIDSKLCLQLMVIQ